MIYEIIKDLCKSKGITVTKAESDMGYARSTLCKIDKNIPSIDKLQKIADYFGVSIEYLRNGSASANVHTTNNNIKVMDENDNVIVLDDEALEIIDALRTKPEMKILFSVSKKASKEDIIKAVKIIEALKEEGE